MSSASHRQFIGRLLYLMIIFASPPMGLRAAEVPIVLAADAPSNVNLAARDLAHGLGRMYPKEHFSIVTDVPADGMAIMIGQASDVLVRARLDNMVPTAPESFVVRTRASGRLDLGVIAGADPRGTAYGVYALLRELGCGFDLSGDIPPAPFAKPFSFDAWQLADQPLVRDRLVFNWHNFISGCSTWNLSDWNRWTDQSLKMGFNGIMVHAYGNNPMVSFEFNGLEKPVGFLSSSVKGRDWATMHVNDVRRLWGGEVFNEAVFGADAALAPDQNRVDAARKLMHDAFAHARQRGMEIYFANEVDTLASNPQGMIQSLPEEARFSIRMKPDERTGKEVPLFWLANPDTPEGFRYYKVQTEALLKDYPQITCLVMWYRSVSPLMELKLAEMPAAWQQQYAAELATTPEAAKLWKAPQVFALGKIIRGFTRALRELGHHQVRVAAGTWNFQSLASADRFFPREVKWIGLDYNVLSGAPQLGSAASRKIIRDGAANREVIPVIWAHHDDGTYIGRPYTPFEGFFAKLADAKAGGYGIIHWTTRPLDLFFISHARQVWQSSRDQSLRTTCNDLAGKWFGTANQDAMGDYLARWATGAPMFARETSDRFVDQEMTDVEQVVAGCRERLKLLAMADAANLTAQQRGRLDYFKGLEEFMADFYRAEGAYQKSRALLKAGDAPAARTAILQCQPEKIIGRFAGFSALGGITRGEQGLVVSLNTRWLSHIIGQRQGLGLEPVRITFAPTQHDKLAQAPGRFSFHFATDRTVWECRGEEETGAKIVAFPESVRGTGTAASPETEICSKGVVSDKPLAFTLCPLTAGGGGTAVIPAGEYRLRLLWRDPFSSAPGQRLFDVVAEAEDGSARAPGGDTGRTTGASPLPDRVDIFRLAATPDAIVERCYPVTLGHAGVVKVTLTPVKGQVLLCGAVLEPATKQVGKLPRIR